jgi:N-acyl-D-amino-acid deacylase
MTGALADRFMLPERGYLKEGYYADLTVFDEETLKNGVSDREKPFGIEKVFINGKLVYSDDRMDEDTLKNTGRAIPVFG